MGIKNFYPSFLTGGNKGYMQSKGHYSSQLGNLVGQRQGERRG